MIAALKCQLSHDSAKKNRPKVGRLGVVRAGGPTRRLHHRHAFGPYMVVLLQPVLVAHYLAIQLVDQLVHGGI